MSELNDSAAKQANDLAVIAALAQETRRPVDEVRQVYEVELARVKTNARITDFVPLFASRRTKARLARDEPRSVEDESSS